MEMQRVVGIAARAEHGLERPARRLAHRIEKACLPFPPAPALTSMRRAVRQAEARNVDGVAESVLGELRVPLRGRQT